MTPRSLQVLHEIVGAYIATGEPVASRSIARRRRDGLSAASIRNVMADLDEEGYLMKEGMFRKNSKDSGHYHSNWLSMMYPRVPGWFFRTG